MGNKINIAIITTFTNSLLNAKLIPLSKIDDVDNILLVCDKPGPTIEKVMYILPPRLLYKIALHKSFAKLFMLFYITKKYKTKVIMAYNIFPHGINAWIAGKIFGGTIIQHFPGGYAELTVKKEISDNSLVKNFPVFEKLVEITNRFVTKNSNYLMVPGQRTKDYLLNELNIKSEKIYKIHSTVDVSRFVPMDSNKIYDIVVVANFRKVKRLDMFIDIIAHIKECMPNIKAIILGDGELRSELISKVKELGLENNIEFAGSQPFPEHYYTKSKIFVLTSNTEGLSTAVMEAMSCGVPAVAPNVGDMSDVVISGKTGYLVVNINDRMEYVKSILEILSDDKTRKFMSVNCTTLINQKHSFRVAEELWNQFFINLKNQEK